MNENGTRNNPLMNEGAGGVDVPQALFYDCLLVIFCLIRSSLLWSLKL